MLKNINHQLHFYSDESGETLDEPFCQEITVERVITEDIFNPIKKLELLVHLSDGPVPVTLMRGDLNKGNFLSTLTAYGLTIHNDKDKRNATELREYIFQMEKLAPTVNYHKKLGFWKYRDKPIFLADTVIGDDTIHSQFENPAVTAPRGTLAGWRKAIKKLVIGNPSLEFALALGLSAPIAHLLRANRAYSEIPIWAFVGETSTGKTTTLMLIASIYGSSDQTGGLIEDLHMTEKAFFATLSNRIGLPLILDEATNKADASAKGFTLSLTVYSLSKGEDWGRCKSSGELQERKIFSGVILISSEQSLLDQDKVNMGNHARMVELNIPWTNSADHAEQIKDALGRNCGTAVYPFVKALLKIQSKDPEKLKQMFRKERDILKAKIGQVSAMNERPLNMFATVVVAAIVGNAVLKLGLDVSQIREFAAQQFENLPKADNLAQKLYDEIITYTIEHSSHFPEKDHRGYFTAPPVDQWGECYSENGKKVLWIMESKFAKAAGDAGFSNYRQLLSRMCDMGLIKSINKGQSRGYLDSKHRLNGVQTPCYCLILI